MVAVRRSFCWTALTFQMGILKLCVCSFYWISWNYNAIDYLFIFFVFIFADVNDLMGQVKFFLKFDYGIKTANVEEVKENWPELAVQYLEQHLVIQ